MERRGSQLAKDVSGCGAARAERRLEDEGGRREPAKSDNLL